MTRYEQVKNMTTEEYFNGNQFSIDAFNKKYRLNDTETFIHALKRVCDYIASVEKTDELKEYWSDRWFSEIFEDWWKPGGSIWQGSGSGRKISLANCSTLSMGSLHDTEEWDSLEAIFKNAAYSMAKCAAYRQGLGIDCSRLRPKGSEILNSANISEGSIHWMKFFDNIGYLVGQKGRVCAFLLSLSIKHPDIEDFITVKSDRTKIQNANISVQISNDFYECVKKDEEWICEFIIPKQKAGQKIYVDVHSTDMDCKKDEKGWYYIAKKDKKEERIVKKHNAKKLLELIAKNMYENAEPGIQNIDIARKYSNSDAIYDSNDTYDSRIISTNACCVVGETEVLTTYGYMKIEDIYRQVKDGKEFSVMSFNTQKRKFEIKKILNAWQTRNDNTVKLNLAKANVGFRGAVHTDLGNRHMFLECSLDHPILVKYDYHYKYVEASKFESKERCVYYNNNEETGKIFVLNKVFSDEIKPLFDIEVKDNHNFVVNGGLVVKNSEQYLSRESLCVLGSINVGKFNSDENEYKKELDIIGESINRFLDNVNECELVYETYATPHQKLAIQKLRRTGSGITNIGGWLFKSNLEYGNEKSNDDVANFMDYYNYVLYKSSEKLGKEKGSFGLFNKEKFIKSTFVKNIMKKHPDLIFDHMRNCTCSTIPPVGTTTLMFREMLMSYGIEQSFGIYYYKRTRISGKYEYYFVVPRIVRDVFEKAGYTIPMKSDTIRDTWDGKYGKPISKFIDEHKNKIGIHFKNAPEISPFDKLDLMSKVMKYVDSSISVTYMLPEDTKWKDVYDFILTAYEKEVKSIAAFPDRKMYGIVSYIPFKELAMKLRDEGMDIHPQNFSESEQKELSMSNEFIKLATAPERPDVLDADIYSVTVKDNKYIIVIGILNGAPYEMFGGKMNGLGFKFQYKKGKIEKLARGKYKLEFDDIEVADFSEQFTSVEQILFRMVSGGLRYGMPIKFIVEQLNKATEDVTTLSAAAARVLKKYIKDGEKVSGLECPNCHQSDTLYYNEGCATCSCGWSRCS